MATTDKDYTITGTTPATSYSFDFPYMKAKDVQVELNGIRLIPIEEEDLNSNPPKPHKFTRQTTQITLVDTPTSGNKLRIYRETDDSGLTSTFYPGSAIRSNDLNDNFTQNLYSTQENTKDADLALDNSRRWDATLDNGTGNWKSAFDKSADAVATADLAKTATDTYVHDGTNLKGGGPPDGEPKGVKWAVDQSEDAVATANLALPKTGGTMTGNIVLVAGDITAADIGNDEINSQHYAAGSIDNEHLAANSVNSDQYVNLSIKDEHIDNGTLTSAKFSAATVVTNSEQATATADDTSFFTTSAADSRYFNVDDGETVTSSTDFGDSDSAIATTKSINNRIIELVDGVGGFWPIANETSFPDANPDINDPATGGTIVSIKALTSDITTGSGVTSHSITDGAGSGNNVIINGLTESTTYAAGFGMLVETTSTLHTYTFHRLVPKATEVTIVSGNTTNINTVAGNNANITAVAGNTTNINSVASNDANINTVAGKITEVETVADNIDDFGTYADQYQISVSAPTARVDTTALQIGDLWFDSSSNKAMMVRDGSAGDGYSAVTPTQAVLDDISIVAGDLIWYNNLGMITDAIDTGTGTGSLDTCATNITNINTFANVYRISASEPSTSKDPGDLWYDTVGNALKVYNGTSFNATAVEGMDELVDDTSPKLGGPLNCDEQEISHIKLDFGTLT